MEFTLLSKDRDYLYSICNIYKIKKKEKNCKKNKNIAEYIRVL